MSAFGAGGCGRPKWATFKALRQCRFMYKITHKLKLMLLFSKGEKRA